ncbi:MAG: hypothetical protein CM1200mP35_04840 [Chloroflexota bacterium]|nr:MAG: hypothetical protein CM1200mP35_04840 [Chloroflexota bacterium]
MGWGFGAEAGEYDHLIERGIIDPAKVVRFPLFKKAGSIAGMMLKYSGSGHRNPQICAVFRQTFKTSCMTNSP